MDCDHNFGNNHNVYDYVLLWKSFNLAFLFKKLTMKIYTILSALIIPSVLLLSACKSDKEQPEEKTEQKHTVDTTEKKESKKKKTCCQSA